MKCSIPDCVGEAEKRGWCGKHYRRWHRTGSPLIVRLHPRKHGLHTHPLYNTWNTMMARCYNPNQVQFHRYGARGIRVCERWHDVAAFIVDMHPKPPGYSIDRRDGLQNYSPENCRWATPTEQSRNRRNKLDEDKAREIRRLFAEGTPQFILAQRFGVGAVTLHNVVRNKTWR